MSLHLGNLSSRIRKDELERVFRRFGRCTVRIKDKYGFVVYDYPACAEKALKTLRGKRICGEPITLSWSNRQRQALQLFDRGGKSYKAPQERYSVKDRVGSNGKYNHNMEFKKIDSEGRKPGSSDLVDEARSYPSNNLNCCAGEKDRAVFDDSHEASGKNHMEDDRWGEQVLDPSNENGLENGLEFDRYEPYYSDDKKEQNELQDASYFGGSPTRTKSPEKTGFGQNDHHKILDHLSNSKSRKTCYACGKVGHEMRKCPSQLERPRTRSQLPSQSSDAAPMRHQKNDREPSTSRNNRRLLRRGGSPSAQLTSRHRKQKYRENNRNKTDCESPDRHRSKKARVLLSSSTHSDCTASRLQSPSRSISSFSGSVSHSKFKSASSRKNSPSAHSWSSTSYHSGSKPFMSRLTSSSNSPTSLALPVALDRCFSSSPNKMQTDYRGDEKLVKGVSGTKSENITVTENESAAAALREEGMKKDLAIREDAHNIAFTSDSCQLLESYNTQSDNSNHNWDNLMLQSEKEMRETPNEYCVVEHTSAKEPEISVRSNAAQSTRLSSEEMYTVLKHYRLEHPEEDKKDLPAETYLGCARTWPWEIIYYRKLKKGAISAENYARRIAQNKEFCIVDNYIRGSSGWGELGEDNP
ncbi:serine/arginine-rich splicing factor 6-like isoform X2 [Olea europaea var. sylvestris]|nr:serine/arginine-rich splicing factor 6-like isoform X2 [Olea europaea var. sylvestris]XP_022899081.1 serine/arginine-rich splicing factor 6-like isoform X2 [Olea europaea var. sylvestris]